MNHRFINQLCQYKSNYFGKAVNTTSSVTSPKYSINPNYFQTEPTSITHSITFMSLIQDIWIKYVFEKIGGIKNRLQSFTKIRTNDDVNERQEMEYIKFPLLVLAEKTIVARTKFNKDLIIGKKCYLKVQAFDPIDCKPIPQQFWVLDDWIEPLTSNSYIEDYKKSLLEQFFKK